MKRKLSIPTAILTIRHSRDVQGHFVNLCVVELCRFGLVASTIPRPTFACHLRSMSRSIRTSSVVTKLIATPFRPKRPPRPIR